MFENSVVVVTGAASGIGKAAAELFARQGASVAIADINVDKGEAAANAIRQDGGEAIFVETDVADPKAIQRLVAETVSAFGPVDVLCNNAADLSLLAKDDHLLNTEFEVWEATLRADALSAAFASKCVVPGMLERGRGAIVNVSSVDGISGDDTRFGYAMAKSALNMLTKMIATRYGKQGVRCNCVAPGLVITPAAEAGLTPEVIDAFDRNTLAPGYGAKPEDVASVMAFLASDQAAFINGEVIRVDGGLLSHVTHMADMRRVFDQG
ncbi:MAG: SDR family oxidoreductase [Pseudomonadota bacterium]